MEATLKNVLMVNEAAKKIAADNPNFSIEQIESKIPKVVDSFSGEVFSYDAAVAAWNEVHPQNPAEFAEKFKNVMGISVEEYETIIKAESDLNDYSDAQD